MPPRTPPYTQGTGEYQDINGKAVRVSMVDGKSWRIPVPLGFKDLDSHNPAPDSYSVARPDDQPWHMATRHNITQFDGSGRDRGRYAFYSLPAAKLPEFSMAQLWFDEPPMDSMDSYANPTLSAALFKYLSAGTPITQKNWKQIIAKKGMTRAMTEYVHNGDKITVAITSGQGRLTPEDEKRYADLHKKNALPVGGTDTSSYPAADISLSFSFEKQEVYMLLELIPLKDQQSLKDGVERILAWKEEANSFEQKKGAEAPFKL